MSDAKHECEKAQFISYIGWVVNVEEYQKLERELAEAKAELECLRARKGHASGCSVMAYNSTGHCNCGYANIQEGKVIWGQLTAHKAALEKCEKALLATWDDLDHLNHWMPTPCRELYMEAKLEIAKLKGNKRTQPLKSSFAPL